ncbi:DUF1015 domain-containing protein [Brumimicrobium salinarum]|uniref:DUF1015 domain-containing protein n=1 Tax=Brumimicrobium salinarum TaxID=2058658 RepID=A0A2I0R0A9_9FLAO|nr:DUF1015 domain-containing protein [Brumimicrobium salinarum]PKR80007.1 DUF1015 domain-containing protein [Brumimicrobium salinarum]
MTKIKAFKAIRPVRSKAQLVASRAVAAYKNSILEAKLESNPYTFIHIIHPEFFENDETRTAPNSEERFLKVKSKYEEFIERGILAQDEEESLYVYRQTTPNHTYLGVIGGASVQEYKNNQIKKHEATLASREEMFTKYLDVVGMNAEPVLLSHKKSDQLDKILAKIVEKRAEYEFTTTDQITHEMWIANATEVENIQAAYEEIDTCYIADGHHRSASSVRLKDLISGRGNYDEHKNYNSFLSFFIDEERLNILPFNRLCKSLNGHSKETLLSLTKKHFSIKALDRPYPPVQLHDIHMFVDRSWYRLRLDIEKHTKLDAVSSIDAEILTRYILSPILGVHDLTTDPNVSFLSGENEILNIEHSVNSGKNEVGFLLYPVTMEQLKAVADENAIMPPKSTWIEPKMRSGLTIYKINE